MQYIMECWADENCGKEFTVVAPSRGTDELTMGIKVKCTNCEHPYIFTVDGDGEPELQDVSGNPDSIGQNITGHDSESSTHY